MVLYSPHLGKNPRITRPLFYYFLQLLKLLAKIILKHDPRGEEGSFRVFLATNLTSSQVIGSSSIIKVVNNRNFGLDSFFTAVLPCHTGQYFKHF